MQPSPLLPLLGLVVAGCAGPSPCPSAAGCPAGTVCRQDGTCGALTRPLAVRFARTRALESVDWGFRRADAPSRVAADSDVLPLGGPAQATLHLAFAPVPPRRAVVRAILVLSVHDGPDRPARLFVTRTDRFEGAGLTWKNAPATAGTDPVLTRVLPGVGHAVQVDVTPLIPAAPTPGGRLHLAIRTLDPREAGTLRLDSPRAQIHARRPRLHVLAEPGSALAGPTRSL